MAVLMPSHGETTAAPPCPLPLRIAKARDPAVLIASLTGRRRVSGQCASARGPGETLRAIAGTPPASEWDERARRRIAAQKAHLEARFQDASEDVIDDFLHGLAVGDVEPGAAPRRRPGTAPPSRPESSPPHLPPAAEAAAQACAAAPPLPAGLRALGVQGAGRLAQEVADLKMRVALVTREKQALQEQLTEREERIRRLEEDLERFRKDPHSLHPAVQRLRKMGLNTPAMSELGERWAGYVMGRCSTAMEVGSYAFRSAFANHAVGGVLTEESFKSVIMQFEPTIKSDQLTRLWFFADSDGSGRLDLFEYMRLFGCNANGDMSEEYFEVVIMHLYRKFHARGGVRRVFAAADKTQSQHLNVPEWIRLLQHHDVPLTKQEMAQIFHRMNVSGSGHLSLFELDNALENAASKCFVSEKWVRETFHSLAVALQVGGLKIRQLIPAQSITVKEFSDLMKRFMPRLRPSQLDRLWKFVLTSLPQEDNAKVHSEAQVSIDIDNFLAVAFGPTLSARDASPLDSSPSLPGGIGKEVLEQLASLLLQRLGPAAVSRCFEVLDPFITPEHFHEQLTGKFGLQYDAIKIKQVFGLLDLDRDGRITRYEFQHLFEALAAGGHRGAGVLEGASEAQALESAIADGDKIQIHRLLNRVYLMERELQQYRGAQGRIVYQGDVVPTVPEKQYQQLSIAHAKAMNTIQKLRAELGPRQEPVRPSMVHDAPAIPDEVSLPNSRRPSFTGRQLRATIMGASALTLPRSTSSPRGAVTFTEEPPAMAFSRALTLDDSRHLTGGDDGDYEEDDSRQKEVELLKKRCRELEDALARSQAARAADADDFKARMWSLQEENIGLLNRAEGAASLMSSPRRTPRRSSAEPDANTTSNLVRAFTDALSKNATLKNVAQSNKAAVKPVDPIGSLRKALRSFALEPVPAHELSETLAGYIVDDRYRIEAVVGISKTSVKVRCRDVLLCRPVVVKLVHDLRGGPDMVKEACIMSALGAVPHVPDVYQFSSAYAGLPFSVMELLQGETLASVFGAVQAGRREAMSFLEAAELADALLTGVDLCHQEHILNLGIQPDTIWISPPLQGARVRLLDWESARSFGGRGLGAEVDVAIQGRHRPVNRELPVFYRGRNEAEVPPHALCQAAFDQADRVFPSLHLKGYGALHYMSMEQVYNFILDMERDSLESVRWEWAPASAGPTSKVEGTVVHWWERGDGLVATAMPIMGTSPLGRLFEVEIHKIMSMVRRTTSDLGFRIGLTSAAPQTHYVERNRMQAHFLHNAWVVGGDSAFYRKGERLVAASTPPNPDAAPPSEAGDPGDTPKSAAPTVGDRWFHIRSALRIGDRVGILAEWTGDISVFVNSERIGFWPQAMLPWEAMQPLYGLVDLYTRDGTDEHNIRAVELITPTEAAQTACGGPLAEKMLSELRSIHRIIHMPTATSIGPACDVYACARVLLQCFRGGLPVRLPQSVLQFQAAAAQWVRMKCPLTETCYYLLAAIRELQATPEGDLSEVQSQGVRTALVRALKTPRYARFHSCWEFARHLNEATGWLDMTPEFMRSHLVAVEQSQRRREVEEWYTQRHVEDGSAAPDDSGDESSTGGGGSHGAGGAGGRGSLLALPPEPPQAAAVAPVLWDLRSYDLGHSHITHIIQVLTKWRTPNPIKIVALSRLTAHIPEELQQQFVACCTLRIPKDEETPSRPTPTRRRPSGNRHMSLFGNGPVSAVELGEVDPSSGDELLDGASGPQAGRQLTQAMLEDVLLPARELPKDRFPLAELLKRRVLWLAAHLVQRLDLEPESHSATPLGADRDAVAVLASAVAKSRVLTRLSLRSSALGHIGGYELSAAVRQCRQLQLLDLSDNALGPKAAAKVVRAIEQGNNVTSLDLSRNSIGCAGVQALSEPLASCARLRELRLSQNNIKLEGAEALAESLLTNSALTYLNLSHNEIPLKGAGDLMRSSGPSRTMRALVLDYNVAWPSYEGNEMLVHAFVESLARRERLQQSCLECLSLKHCGVRSTAAVRLFETLAISGTIKKLCLAWNGIRQTGAAELAKALLAPVCALEELDVRDNNFGQQEAFPMALREASGSSARGYPSFTDSLAEASSDNGVVGVPSSPQRRGANNRLRVLHLANNGLTAIGACLLAEGLMTFEALEQLMVYHNPEIGDAGLEGLARLLLPRNPKTRGLRVLSVAACGAGDPGCRAVANAVTRNETLTSLDLSCNAVTNVSAPSLGEALAVNRKLEILNLAMNRIGPTGIQELLKGAGDLGGNEVIKEVDVSAQASQEDQKERAAVADFLASVRKGVLAKFKGLE